MTGNQVTTKFITTEWGPNLESAVSSYLNTIDPSQIISISHSSYLDSREVPSHSAMIVHHNRNPKDPNDR